MSETILKKARRWWVDLLAVVAVVFAIRACQAHDLASGAAPALEGRAPDGRRLSLAEYAGQPVLVYFWATWCGVCSAMRGNVQDVARDYPVLTVASGSGQGGALLRYMAEHELGYPVMEDPDGRLARRYGVGAFPTTFYIDADGQISAREVGYTTELGMRARLWLAGR